MAHRLGWSCYCLNHGLHGLHGFHRWPTGTGDAVMLTEAWRPTGFFRVICVILFIGDSEGVQMAHRLGWSCYCLNHGLHRLHGFHRWRTGTGGDVKLTKAWRPTGFFRVIGVILFISDSEGALFVSYVTGCKVHYLGRTFARLRCINKVSTGVPLARLRWLGST